MKRAATAALMVAFAGLVGVAFAADEKADPNGTWKWSFTMGEKTRDVTLKLKLDGDKLTGTVSGRDPKGEGTAIGDASFKDGDIAFTVTRERNGQKFTSKYTGKLSGDAIKGKTEFERDGKSESRDWEAKRVKE